MHKRISRKHLAGSPIHDVYVAIAIRMRQDLARAAVDAEVEQNILVHGIVIVIVVREYLVRPDSFTGLRFAGEQRSGPFVVARALIGVPRARIGGAVIEKVEIRIVRGPTPGGASANFPLFTLPRMKTEVFGAISGVKRLETGADEDIFIRAGGVSAPEDLAGIGVQTREPAAHSVLTTAVAHEHHALGDDRRHRNRLAVVDIAQLGFPDLFSSARLHRYGLYV